MKKKNNAHFISNTPISRSQGSILGPILFNIFLNALFYWVQKSDLHKFADASKLVETLGRENQIATDWFKENNVIVNGDRFQAIIVNRNSDMRNRYTLNVDGNQVTLINS